MSQLSSNAAPSARRPYLAAVLLCTVFLAGCTGTTYGTGRSAGLQTLKDFGAIPGGDKVEIDYRARPPIVTPPVIGALPPPGSGNQGATAANWPVDPDEQARQVKAWQQANAAANSDDTRLPRNSKDPRFSLPDDYVAPRPVRSELSAAQAARGSKAEDERAKLARASLNDPGAVDEYGNPVRRYLTDPPDGYRVPDPNSPVSTDVVEKCKPRLRFPWQPKPEGC